MAMPMLFCYVAGLCIRLWLFQSQVVDWVSNQNEVVTPLTSWKRVTEGLALQKAKISPYSGDLFHEAPLLLELLNFITSFFPKSLHLVFVSIDIAIAVVLDQIAKHLARYLLVKQQREVKSYATDVSSLLLKTGRLRHTRLLVVAAYLFNPYSIVTCLAKSTAVFNNLAVLLAVLFTIQGRRMKASLFIAVAAYLSLYPIMLVVPAAIHIAQMETKSLNLRSSLAVMSMIQTFICCFAGVLVLIYASFMLQESWQFLSATYGFILSAPDLTPNIGIFWYFFTEMFEHFRVFFLAVFQINVFIYTLPLAVRFRDHPIFLMYVLIAVMSIFKSYPSYADAAVYISMLPLWRHAFQYLNNGLLVTCMLICCAVLCPIMWHMWIYAGSANANFYFAITLVYTTAQVFLLTDVIFAYLRREYALIHGMKPKEIDGKKVPVVLQ